MNISSKKCEATIKDIPCQNKASVSVEKLGTVKKETITLCGDCMFAFHSKLIGQPLRVKDL